MSENNNMDFSNSVNFLGPPPGFVEHAADLVAENMSYPDRYQTEARKTLAASLNVSENCVAFSVGATELISVIPFLSKRRAVVLSPSFWEYKYFYAKLHGEDNCIPHILKEEDNFQLNFDELGETIKNAGADTCYLSNPNNPTTTQLEKSSIINLITSHDDVLFVIDETYLPFSKHYECQTLSKEAALYQNVVVIGSFSKVYALPGIRLGYAVSSVSNIERIYKHLLPYGVPTQSLKLLPWMLKQQEFLSKTHKMYEATAANCVGMMRDKFGSSIKIFHSDAPFIFIKMSSKRNIVDTLKEKYGIMVRDGSEFDHLNGNFIRVTIRSSDDMEFLLEAVTESLK